MPRGTADNTHTLTDATLNKAGTYTTRPPLSSSRIAPGSPTLSEM